MIASAAVRRVNPIRVVAAPTDWAVPLLCSKYHPPTLSKSKPLPVKPSKRAMEVHCMIERLARATRSD